MKKLLFLILAAFIFSSCGGRQPETEPVKPTLPPKATEELKPQEPTEPTQPQEQQSPITAADGRKSQPGPLEEVIPVIETEKKSPGIETPELAGIKTFMESISSGVTTISREFGYPGNIEVPENFQKRVGYYIHYFSNDAKGSQYFLRSISRGSQYLPMIKRIFAEKNLPPSLAYLPMIESGFSPTAHSRAGARGLWQFMRGTARMYGLKVTRVNDERTDPIKSTYAAAEYFNDLLAMFGSEDPFLGICAFNAGEGKILNALRQISYTERSFWTLVKKNLLQNETNEYIPQFLAVILMANHSEKYAAVSPTLSFEPGEPETDEEEDREVINALHHSDTKDDLGAESPQPPVKQENTGIESPGAESLKPSPSNLPSDQPYLYNVKPGDTLYSIAKRCKVDLTQLKKWNRLSSNHINAGQNLKIYPPGTSAAGSAGSRDDLASPSVKAASKPYKLIYTVNYSDSLVRIALFFKGVSARDIMTWNRLSRSRIHPKQKLVLYLNEPPRKVLVHTIKPGENAFQIARKYRVRVEYVLSLNDLVTNSPLKPGQQVKIYFF